MLRKKAIPIIVVLAFVFLVGCGGGLVPPQGGELTDKDIALDKYYQALKWSNNTLSNTMANIKLFPVKEQRVWIIRADPIKQGVDSALAGWKLAVDSEDWVDLNANREEFKRLKNELLDLVFELGKLIG